MSETPTPQPPQAPRGIRRRLILLALLLLTAGWLFFIFQTPGCRPIVIFPFEGPRLSPARSTIDLGRIPMDKPARASFYLYNTGGKHLRLLSVDPSCGCTVAKLKKNVVAPGDFTKLSVTLDTRLKLGKVKKKITITSNDAEHPVHTLYLIAHLTPENMGEAGPGHGRPVVKNRLALFEGRCATCHVSLGRGKTGKDLFLADCAMCHGEKAEGLADVAPGLLHHNYQDPAVSARLRQIIAEGSPHTPSMPPFSQAQGGPLNAAEIDSLVGFLKFAAQNPALLDE